MALKPLKAVLRLDTVKANRNARNLKKEVQGVDGELKKTGASAGGAGKSLLAWGASGVAAAAAVFAAVSKVTAALDNAIRLRDELGGNAFAIQRQVAGAATQFGLTPEQTVGLLGPTVQQIGGGREGFGAISALATAASSAGLIQDPTLGPGGVPQFQGQGQQVLGTLGGFLQRIGEPGLGGPLSKLVRGGLGEQAATQANVREGLGDILGAFRGSQSANLGTFLQGAQSGTAGLVSAGVSQRTALSIFGGAISVTATEQQAAELLRTLGDKIFIGDDPAIVEEVDKRLGAGSFFELKTKDPTALFEFTLNMLTSVEGKEKADLFARLNIPIEQGARISKLRGAREATATVFERIQETTGADVEAEIRKVTGSGAAVIGATEAGIATRQAGFGEGGKARGVALQRIIAAEKKRAEAEDPILEDIFQTFEPSTVTRRRLLRRFLIRQLEESGVEVGGIRNEGGTIGGASIGIGEEGAEITGGRPETRELLRGIIQRSTGGVSAQQVIINQNGPESRTQNKSTKATPQPTTQPSEN